MSGQSNLAGTRSFDVVGEHFDERSFEGAASGRRPETFGEVFREDFALAGLRAVAGLVVDGGGGRGVEGISAELEGHGIAESSQHSLCVFAAKIEVLGRRATCGVDE